MVYQGLPLPTGRRRVKSDLSVAVTVLPPDTDITNKILENCSESKTIQKEQGNVLQSSTQGSLLKNKKKRVISKDKLPSSKNTVRITTNSSSTSHRASTSNARAFSQFWTSSKKAMSEQLWSPIVTGSLVSERTSLNVSSENMAQHSTWFRTMKIHTPKTSEKNLPTISSQFVTTLWPKTMANEHLTCIEIDSRERLVPQKQPKNKTSIAKTGPSLPVKTTKIKLRVKTETDRIILNKTFGAVRFVYNKCVEHANNSSGKISKKILRSSVMKDDSKTIQENAWLKEVGYDVRDDAIKDFTTAIKGNHTKLREKTIEKFNMKFRSKKRMKSETFYLRKRWIVQTKNAILLRLPNTKPIVLWSGKRSWHNPIMMDCKFQRTNTGNYYLCIPHECGVDNQDPPKNLRVCSLDPGVRTFQTIYDATNCCAYQVAPSDINKIMRLCTVLDKLASHISLSKKSKMRYRMRRVARKLRLRIQNLVNEVHKQLSKFLASNFDLVIIPKFETSGMIKRCDRKIGSKSVRQMVCWSHYRFRERLLNKCRETRTKVAIVDESWTSKTCSCCGNIDYALGGNKLYKCKVCGIVMDRDINGAKNILLKNYEALALQANFGAYTCQNWRQTDIQKSL